MNENYYIQGHKAKTDYGHEDTLILDDDKAYGSLVDAVQRSREYFAGNPELSLVVIFKGKDIGGQDGVKFIHRGDDGQLEEIDHWWG